MKHHSSHTPVACTLDLLHHIARLHTLACAVLCVQPAVEATREWVAIVWRDTIVLVRRRTCARSNIRSVRVRRTFAPGERHLPSRTLAVTICKSYVWITAQARLRPCH